MRSLGKSGIDYAVLMRGAILGLIRDLLSRVSAEGLPGRHHFYISFAPDFDGVEMSASLRARSSSDEMTIVLQHRFASLEVSEDCFSVSLWFGGVSERLTVPFESLTAFADPSAGFALSLGDFSRASGDAGKDEDASSESSGSEGEKREKSEKGEGDAAGAADGGGEVISLESFRKENS